jgi:two-component system, NtrC family, sensor kinase
MLKTKNMKSFIKISLLCLLPAFSLAQIDPTWGYITAKQVDSLKRAVLTEKNDTIKMTAYRSLGFYYQESKPDSGLYFHEKHLALAKKLNMKLWLADAYSQTGFTLLFARDLAKSYEYHTEAMKLASDEKNENDHWRPWTFSNSKNSHDARISILGMNYQMMGNLWGALGDKEKQKAYYLEGAKLGESINNGKVVFLSYSNLIGTFPSDSAILITNKALKFAEASNFPRISGALLRLAINYADKKMWDSAFVFAQRALANAKANNNLNSLAGHYKEVSLLFARQNNKDSCLYYAKKVLETARITGVPRHFLEAYRSLSNANQLNNKTDNAFKYEQLVNRLSDSLYNIRIFNITKYQKFSFDEQFRLKKLDEEKTAYANNLKMMGLLAVLGGILVVAFILYRNNRQKQKANKVLETALTNLKSTQSQLIQSEKMASLGELTAGIAHEIQNPLNFVNNFSEVSTEMIKEIQDERRKTKDERDEELESDLLKDISENMVKINHHGKRAADIVKGMLQHSRSSSGVKEPTDINALADEYLRLAYHGLRAKDKTFNSKFETVFDNAIGKVDVIPQDIGRVILNLITNAFYVVNERQKLNQPGYEPTVVVSTHRSSSGEGRGEVLIKVKDNGNGIPQKILDKIFQPFFTTKPTGQGTGLGLSLSYDIVKAHGGELKVETKEGEGSEFVIQLPINS